jgi:hypothetical protein
MMAEAVEGRDMTEKRYRQLVAGEDHVRSSAEWAADRARRLAAVSAVVGERGRKLIGLDDNGELLEERDPRRSQLRSEADDGIKQLAEPEVLEMGLALFPQFSDAFGRAWSLLAELPTQSGHDGIWFRAPGRADLLLPARRSFMELLLRVLHGVDQTLPWIAANFQADGRDWGLQELGVLLAAAMDAGGEQGEAVWRALQEAEHERHVTTAMLCCAKPECWSLVIDRVASPQCEEWRREEILQAAHYARPEALAACAQAMVERNLLQFPEAAQAAESWLGLSLDEGSAPRLAAWVAMIRDGEARRSAFAGDDVQQSYIAIRAAALDDLSSALAAVDLMLASPAAEKRFLAVHALGELDVADCLVGLSRALEDADERVAVYAAKRIDKLMRRLAEYVTVELRGVSNWGPKPPSAVAGVHELWSKLRALTERLPAEAKPLPRIPWPETEEDLNVSRQAVADTLPMAIAQRPPAVLAPYLADMSIRGRRSVAWLIGQFASGEDDERKMLLALLSDANEDVQADAAKSLQMQGVRQADLPVLEALLTREASKLRVAVTRLIATLSDAEAIASASRLLASAEARQRLGGLEVLSLLKDAGRWPGEARATVVGFAASNRDERVYKAKLEGNAQPLTLDDALGLVDVSHLTRRQPVRLGVVHCSAASASLLSSLDVLIEAHRDELVAPWAYRGNTKAMPLGELDHCWPSALLNRHTYPKDEAGRPAKHVLPMHEVWFDWWRNRPFRDDDGLEGVRAAHVASLSRLGRYRESWMGKVFAELIVDAPSLQHPRACQEILQWILVHDTPAGIGGFAVDAYEDALARVPAEPNESDLSLFVSDWSTDSLIQIARDGGDWSSEHERRRWAMASWADPTTGGSDEERRMLEGVLLPAFDAGAATDADLLWALLGQRPNRPFQKVFRELGEASSMLRCGTLSQRAAAVVERAIKRVVEIELNRGEQATEATLPALYLRNAGGASTLLQLLEALPGEPVRTLTEPTESNPRDVSRAGVWSWLIQSTWPTAADTPVAFAAAAKLAQVGEDTLLRTAVFAPQWAEHIEATLGWPALAEAVWWLRAHIRRGIWIVNPDKKEVWQAAVQRRAKLSFDEMHEGAVDADWFARVVGVFGEERWHRLAGVAKFASSEMEYERAVRSAATMLERASTGAPHGASPEQRT